MALQNFHATAQGGEEIFECNGDDDDQRIFSEERAVDRLTNYRESVRAKADAQSEQKGMITTQSLSPADAFEIFQGKIFSTRTEYAAPDTVEMRVETPIQRYSRLRLELDELRSDLDSMSSESEKPSDSTIWSILQAEAKKLVSQSDSLKDHQGFQAFETKTSSMMGRLDKAIAGKKTEKEKEKETLSSSSIPTSQKTQNKEQNSECSDVSVLERRIFALENFLGSSANVLNIEATQGVGPGSHSLEDSLMNSSAGTCSVVDSINRLEKRLSLLDGPTLEGLRLKVSALRLELESTTKIKSSPAETQIIEAVKKVDDLYEKINRVQAVATDLPALILRLKTLENVHRQAASFSLKLSNIESIAQSASEDLKNNSDVLANLKEGLSVNLSAIKESIQQVDLRLNKLSTK